MKEKPILFTAPMVQALLNTKPNVWPAKPIDPNKPFTSMTRRVVKLPKDAPAGRIPFFENIPNPSLGVHAYWQVKPRYEVGDLLWVRETWRVSCAILAGGEESACLVYKTGEGKTISINNKESLFYTTKARWQSPIFLPRKAARLFLEVKSVRVERLQDITPYDACLEGMLIKLPGAITNPLEFPDGFNDWTESKKDEWFKHSARATYMAQCDVMDKLVNKYRILWDSINAKRGYSWYSNPYVWVYEFMRVEK